MPLLRDLAVADGGARRVGRMPGFGFLIERPGEPPRYACDALFDIAPLDLDPPWLALPAGEVLVGTAQGLRRISREGCPSSSVGAGLPTGPVSALGRSPHGAGDTVYAVVGLQKPALYRSRDQGAKFEEASVLPAIGAVSGLLVVTSTTGQRRDVVYVVQEASSTSSLVSWSQDGGTTWLSELHEGSMVPLVGLADRDMLVRRTMSGERSVQLVRLGISQRADAVVLEVRYFGGIARDAATGYLWAADEGGGVYRSSDDGLSFKEIDFNAAPACLAHDGEALWACFSGLPAQPAIARRGEHGTWMQERSLSEVTEMVDCGAALDVERACAAAWLDWQVDVLLAAGVPLPKPDGGAPAALDSGTSDGLAPAPVAPESAPLTAGSYKPIRIYDAGSMDSQAPGHNCHVMDPGIPTTRPFALVMALLVSLRLVARARHGDRLASDDMDESPNASLSDDAALMAAAQRGDANAFMALFDRHAPTMLALGCRILGEASQAEDLLHDVFLEAWRAVRSYNGARASVRTWLLVRMRSRALDRLNRRAVETRARDLLERLQTVVPDVPVERVLLVRQCVNRLDRKVREALELTYYFGMTAPEVAICLSIPEGTVRSRLARGVRTLTHLLSEEPPHDQE